MNDLALKLYDPDFWEPVLRVMPLFNDKVEDCVIAAIAAITRMPEAWVRDRKFDYLRSRVAEIHGEVHGNNGTIN